MQAPTSSLLQLYRAQWALLIALAVGPTMVACGAQPTPPTGCTAGIQIQCPCPGGAKGVQVCLPEGGFGPCTECAAADAAPTDIVGAKDADSAGNSLDQIDGAGDLDATPGDTAPVVDASAATPTCSDQVANGLETDIDCGGPSCGSCPTGSACGIGSDCKSAICLNQKCQAPDNCKNKKKDDLETDVDCGGAACPACGLGMSCLVAQDCGDGACVNGSCGPGASCNDGKTNGQETATDCGGPVCAKCAVGSKCAGPTDCLSNQCLATICSDKQGCANGVKGGKETDVDCGGDCGPCEAGKSCVAAGDCTSKLCINSSCTAPSCSDQVKNGQEADVDCGGGADCVPCANGQACQVAADCLGQLCFNGACKAQPTCTDGVKNGTETFKDCGGSKCSPCEAGQTCLAEGDCASQICKNSVCQAATCSDGVKNGKETAIDCGGGGPCAPCALGLACKVTADCATAVSPCSIVGCSADKCSVVGQKACDDAIACTADKCDPGTGQCMYTADAAKWCDDGNGCTDDNCLLNTGCSHVVNLAACTDGNSCTVGDLCSQGKCTGLPLDTSTACDDENECTKDACEPMVGCQHFANTSPCNADNNPCTTNDSCAGKVCIAGAQKVCDDKQFCTVDSCDKVDGSCFATGGLQNGKPCEDGDVCTIGDVCGSGKCGGKVKKNCDDNNQCTGDTCDPIVGCINLAQTAACGDGNACTDSDKCISGQCVGTPKICADGNGCTADVCNSQNGLCTQPNSPEGTPCEVDGNLCTSDSCKFGTCSVGAAKSCDDSNECTVDACEPASGACKSSNKSMPCAGGTGYCSSGKCNCGGSSPAICGGFCKDLATDSQNCEACNKTCGQGSICQKSICSKSISFAAPQVYPNKSNYGDLAVADINGDGFKDMLVPDNYTYRVHTGNGKGEFVVGATLAVGLHPYSIAVGDFDLDGKVDAVVGSALSNGKNIYVFINTGKGILGTPTAISSGGNNPYWVRIGDVSGDGKPDILVSDTPGNSVSVLTNAGTGTFTLPVTYTGFNSPYPVAIDDVDGNGSLDVIVPNRGNATVSILRNKGNGLFEKPVHLPIGGSKFAASVTISDIDLDGKKDLLVGGVTSSLNPGLVALLKANGQPGVFAFSVEFPIQKPGSIVGLAIGDLNSDGLPDMLVCGGGEGKDHVFINNSNNSFALVPVPGLSVASTGCLLADINDDGVLDVALVTGQELRIYLNMGKL